KQFVDERGAEPGLQGELGRAQYRLALITGDIDSELKAIALLDQAQHNLVAQQAAQPQVPDWRIDLAKCRHHLGRLYRLTDQIAKSESAYLQALEIWQSLVAAYPKVDSYRADLARSFLGLGNVYQVTRRLEESRASYEKARDTWAVLSKAYPQAADYRRDLAV